MQAENKTETSSSSGSITVYNHMALSTLLLFSRSFRRRNDFVAKGLPCTAQFVVFVRGNNHCFVDVFSTRRLHLWISGRLRFCALLLRAIRPYAEGNVVPSSSI